MRTTRNTVANWNGDNPGSPFSYFLFSFTRNHPPCCCLPSFRRRRECSFFFSFLIFVGSTWSFCLNDVLGREPVTKPLSRNSRKVSFSFFVSFFLSFRLACRNDRSCALGTIMASILITTAAIKHWWKVFASCAESVKRRIKKRNNPADKKTTKTILFAFSRPPTVKYEIASCGVVENKNTRAKREKERNARNCGWIS